MSIRPAVTGGPRAAVLCAPWVLPGSLRPPGATDPNPSAGRAIEDGAVALDDDTVVAVGPRAEVEARYGPGERIDAILLPALVNAHLHLELSHLRGRVEGDGDGLAGWIGRLLAARTAAPPGEAERAMPAAAEELRRFGVAAVGDVTNTLASVPHLSRAGLCGTVFHEVAGFAPERFARIRESGRAERARLGAVPGITVRETPHAVYSIGRKGLDELLRAGPGSIHLAEDPAERLFCREGTGPFRRLLEAMGSTELDALRVRARSAVAAVAGLLGPGHLAVHCVDLDAEDLALLAASGATAVLCPRSNRRIAGARPPLPALLAARVPLSVGTDSLVSSPSLSPLAELALLRRDHSEVPAARLLPLAWNGAAVGAPHIGRLSPGSAPGLLAAPLSGARPVDPFEFLLGSFAEEERPLTWIRQNGREAHP